MTSLVITIKNNNHLNPNESDDEGFNEDSSSSCGQISLTSSSDTTNGTQIECTIKGPSGSIRGKRNTVKNALNNYQELIKLANAEKAEIERNYEKEEQNQCVLYVTSMGIIRQTFEDCRKIKAILNQHLIRFDERDIYINRAFKQELQERMNGSIEVPQLFVNGKRLGSIELVERLNECGQLLTLLANYKMTTTQLKSCQCCGGSKFIPCNHCNGSRKSLVHHFITDSITLRCSHCLATGIVKCPKCYQNQNDDNKGPIEK